MKTLKFWEICQNKAPRSEVFVGQPKNSVEILLLLERENSWVYGLFANLGVGMVSLFCSSLPATGLPVLRRTGSQIVAPGFQA